MKNCVFATVDYWYRDDSLDLWDAIWKFVEEVLSLYYSNDAVIASDGELTMMLSELRYNCTTSLVCYHTTTNPLLGNNNNSFCLQKCCQRWCSG